MVRVDHMHKKYTPIIYSCLLCRIKTQRSPCLMLSTSGVRISDTSSCKAFLVTESKPSRENKGTSAWWSHPIPRILYSQLGWWHSQWKNIAHVPNHQPVFLDQRKNQKIQHTVQHTINHLPAGQNFEIKNKIRQLLYSLYRWKKFKKQLYKNLLDII